MSESVADEVPVDPELTKCFTCLQIIDEFRYQNDASLIDELMLRWQDSESQSQSSCRSSTEMTQQQINQYMGGETSDDLDNLNVNIADVSGK